MPNSFDFFIQPENKASRDSLMSNTNLQQVFPNVNVNMRNTLPKAKSKPSFVIVNVHHSIQKKEIKEELLSNNGMNVVKVSRIIKRASGKTTKLTRVITEATNHVLAAQRQGVKNGWLNYRCEPSKESPHVKQCIKCQKYVHSAIECKKRAALPAMLRSAHSKTMRRTERKCQMCKLWWIARICVQRIFLLSKRSS